MNNKYASSLVLTAVLLVNNFLPKMGVGHHHLLLFGSSPGLVHFDMNGYGSFLPGYLWLQLYWWVFTLLLALAGILLWVRGNETIWRNRLRIARGRFRGPVRIVAAGALLVLAGSGSWIFFNTNVRNRYRSAWQEEKARASYEKKHRRWLDLSHSVVTALSVRMELYPSERRLRARATFTLRNRLDPPAAEIALRTPEDVQVAAIRFGPNPHCQARIVEFPRYVTNAQGFPGTITCSEGLGFIARAGPGDISYPFEIATHEVAHQWWGHQMLGGNVEGGGLLSESMAEYLSAEVPANDLVDVGVIGPSHRLLAVERKRLGAAPAEITFTVAERPEAAGIDPRGLLIDVDPSDDVVPIAWQ